MLSVHSVLVAYHHTSCDWMIIKERLTWMAGGSAELGASPKISAATSAAALRGTTSVASGAVLDPANSPSQHERLTQ